MVFLLQFIKKEKQWVTLCAIFMIFGSLFTISQALLIANVATFTINLDSVKTMIQEESPSNPSIDEARNKEDSIIDRSIKTFSILVDQGNKAAVEYVLQFRDLPFILLLGFICLIFIGCTQFLLFLRDFASQYIAYRISNRVRVHFLEKMIGLPVSVFKNKKSGDFLSRAINDIKQIEAEIYPFLESAFFGPILTIVGLSTLFYINFKFSLIIFITIGLLGVLVQIISSRLKEVVKAVQEKMSDITNHLQEIIYSIDIIKIFNREEFERSKFVSHTTRVLQLLKKQTFIHYLNRPMSELLISTGMVGIIFFSARMIWNNEISITEMFSFFAVLLYITPYLQRISNAFFIKQKIAVAANRVNEIITQYAPESRGYQYQSSSDLSVSSSHIAEFPTPYQGEIKLEKVSFKYDEKEVLKNISFTAKPGEFVAFVGESGGGKTTLLNIIASLIEPSKGMIFFDGIPHTELSLKTIREQIALVSQESLLFPTTIKENILYGKLDATDSEIVAAAKMASVDEFVKKFPEGYDTEIGERGMKVSGGQKQRICIARALIKQPKILLLDEATSALDSQSEQAIQSALKKLLHQQTTFVIAHRLSTILEADKIVVINQGKIEAIGTHKELLKKSPIYAKLYKIQFKG